jgi:predicted amidophosphoribosyltransferase
MPITCPNCRSQNEDGAAFCDNCGTSLASVGAPPPTPKAPSPLPPTAAVGGTTCPQCGQPVIPGEAFCENCGAALTGMAPPPPPSYQPPQQPAQPGYQPPPQPAPPSYQPPPQPAPAGPATCPSCGTPATPGAAFCDNCGASLTGVAPAPPAAQPYPPPYPAPAAAPYPPPGAPAYPAPPAAGPPPRLVVQPSNISLPFPAGKAEIIAGREDPVSNVFPEINLDPHGGDEGGVSRRHAKFTLRGGQWYVEDLNSTNFTFVNKQKLQAGQPHPVNNGDEVRFGRVTLTFFTS